MFVKQMLDLKPNKEVLKVSPRAKVELAVKTLAKKQVGALLVADDLSRLEGVLSERDVIREIGRYGCDVLQRTVASIMTTDVVKCQIADTADSIMKVMTERQIRHLPVFKDDVLVGLISIRDVVKVRLEELHSEQTALKGMISGF